MNARWLVFATGLTLGLWGATNDPFQMSDDELLSGTTNLLGEVPQRSLSTPSNQVRFGGTAHAWAFWGVKRPWGETNYQFSNNTLSSYFQADLNLDIRPAPGFKVFTEFSLIYSPVNPISQTASNTLLLSAKEFFADFNLGQAIYFRLGKQVLTWGRGFFWQPTDLVNLEKRDVVNRDLIREGNYGLRVHIPYKTLFNLYSFLNLGSTLNYDQYAWSVKTEARFGGLEVALSTLLRPKRQAVYGADFSFGLAGWNITGEASLFQEGQMDRLGTNITEVVVFGVTNRIPVPRIYRNDTTFAKASLGATKSFDENRWTFGIEGYYNGEGYDDNRLEDTNFTALWAGNALPTAYLQATALSNFNSQPLADWNKALGRVWYNALDHGKWYAAVFLSRGELFNKTTTIGLTGVLNLLDLSALVSLSASYSPVDQFAVNLRLPFYLGESGREFTFQKNFLPLQLELSYRF